MTIQTDYEEIEKEIRTHKNDEELYYWKGKKQTFITENLKRINETIEFLEEIVYNPKCFECFDTSEDIEYKVLQLKADKIYLEEKNE